MTLEQWEQIANIIRSAATVIALFAGALWSYWVFVQNRQKYPRASIAHRIRHWHTAEGKTLLHVDLRISNIGNVLISLVESRTTVQQVLPLAGDVRQKISAGRDPIQNGESEVDWPTIGEHEVRYEEDECEIESGETQDIEHDFILDEHVRTVEVYSYLMNEKKRPTKLSWDLTTLYDITDSSSE